MKNLLALVLCIAICFGLVGCEKGGKDAEVISDFYDTVYESQQLLDTVADDIYSNWYDAIYNDKFSEDINVAIAAAQLDNAENLDKIEELDAEISDLFKDAKETEHGDLVKSVMAAYSDYYEFVVNVSGSFKSYSADKESLKKELASCLKELSYEI